MVGRDFYALLGVTRTATREQIQRAYRRLARRWHPDVNKSPEAEERFKEINEAYDVLSDPETRARYDEAGGDVRRAAGGADGQRARAPQGGGPHGRVDAQDEAWGSPVDIDDLLGGLFRRRAAGGLRGPDQEAVIDVGLAEVYRGGRQTVSLATASGTRTVTVTIPSGVTDGQRILLAGQGASGRDGGPPGDLYLVVRLCPGDSYRVVGRDVFVDLPLAAWEAALGTSVSVETPTGPVTVRVPAGSSSGRKLRLRGLGLPNPGGRAGDLYAEVRVMVPQQLEPAERQLFEELSRTSRFVPRRTR